MATSNPATPALPPYASSLAASLYATFGTAYESEHLYVLSLPAALGARPTKHYVFSSETNAWSTYSFAQPLEHAISDLGTDQLILSAENAQLWLERKDFASSDHQDVGFTIAAPQTGSLAVFTFPDATHGIKVGDLVTQIQTSPAWYLIQRCTAVSGAVVTLNAAPGQPWISGNLTIQPGIVSTMKLLPVVGPSEMLAKAFDESVQIYFKKFDHDFYQFQAYTDEQPVPEYRQDGYVGSVNETLFGAGLFGGGLFGGDNVQNFVSLQNIGRTHLRAAELSMTFIFSNAACRFELSGLSIGASESLSERIVKA